MAGRRAKEHFRPRPGHPGRGRGGVSGDARRHRQHAGPGGDVSSLGARGVGGVAGCRIPGQRRSLADGRGGARDRGCPGSCRGSVSDPIFERTALGHPARSGVGHGRPAPEALRRGIRRPTTGAKVAVRQLNNCPRSPGKPRARRMGADCQIRRRNPPAARCSGKPVLVPPDRPPTGGTRITLGG